MFRIAFVCSAFAAFGSFALAADRAAGEVYRFRKGELCPVTRNITGACSGYQVDHIEPLCAGGADHRAKTRADVRRCRLLRQSKKVKP